MLAPKGTLFDFSCSVSMILNFVQAPDEYSGNAETDLRDVLSIDAATEAIYEDVQRLIQDLIYLKRHKNSLGIHGSLPREILSEIFRWCPKERETVDDQCYAFSQVCHRWRAIATADRSLWTTPDLMRPHLAKEMYRNRAAKLPLQVHVPNLWHSAVIDLPWELSERTESIDISYSDFRSGIYNSERPEVYVHRFLRAPSGFPILKTLALKSVDDSSEQFLELKFRAPYLRSVTFENCLPFYHSAWLCNLTSLTINLDQCPYQLSNGAAHWSKPISYVLRRNPSLETLVLVGVMNSGQRPRLVPPAPHDTEPIELMRMQALNVKDDIDNIALLLPVLKIPFRSKVHVQADLVLGDDNDVLHIEQLGGALLEFLRINEWTDKFRYMIISPDENSRVQLSESQEHTALFQLDVAPLSYAYEPSTWAKFLATSLLTLDLYGVECRRSKEARPVPMDSVCTALSMLPSLKKLEVFDDLASPHMVEGLLIVLGPYSPNASYAVQTFPNLNALSVIDTRMDEEVSELESDHRRHSVLHRFDTIIDQRRMAGENVPEVTMSRPNHSSIKALVPVMSE